MSQSYSEDNSCRILPQKRFIEHEKGGEEATSSFSKNEDNQGDLESNPSLYLQDDMMNSELSKKMSLKSSVAKISDCRDRYIPTRTTSLLEYGLFINPTSSTHRNHYISETLLGSPSRRILSYEKPSSKKIESTDVLISRVMGERMTGAIANKSAFEPKPIFKFRFYKMLDAVGLYSDFYYHLLSWSNTNRVFTSLKNRTNEFLIYSCTSESLKRTTICASTPIPLGVEPCSIKAFGNKDVISGWKNGQMMVHTIEEQRIQPKHSYTLSDETLNCIEVIDENHLWVGSKTGWMNGYDLRQAKATFRFATNTDITLSHDVLAGIAFNHEYLVAVGTNIGIVKIWDIRRTSNAPYFSDALHNQSGIKALAFNPHAPKELLSGGGSSCRHVIYRNILIRNEPQKIQLGCQVTGVSWLEKKNHFVATTGFNARINLFRLKKHNLEQLTEINLSDGAAGRVIYLATRNNECVVAYDGDETLRYYQIEGIENENRQEFRRDTCMPGLLKTTGPFSIR